MPRNRDKRRRYHCLGIILRAAPLFPERLPVTCKSLWRLMQEDRRVTSAVLAVGQKNVRSVTGDRDSGGGQSKEKLPDMENEGSQAP